MGRWELKVNSDRETRSTTICVDELDRRCMIGHNTGLRYLHNNTYLPRS